MVLNFQTVAGNTHQAIRKNIGFVNVGKDIAVKKMFFTDATQKDLNHARECLDSSPTRRKRFRSQSHLILGFSSLMNIE